MAVETRVERIPVASERFESSDYDVAVQEAIDAINFLIAGGSPTGFSFDSLPKDALAIYYADFVILRLIDDGAESFAATEFPLHELTVRDIEHGLEAIGAEHHVSLFRQFLEDAKRKADDLGRYDRLFQDLQDVENLRSMNDLLLRKSTAFAPMSESEANASIAALLAAKIADGAAH